MRVRAPFTSVRGRVRVRVPLTRVRCPRPRPRPRTGPRPRPRPRTGPCPRNRSTYRFVRRPCPRAGPRCGEAHCHGRDDPRGAARDRVTARNGRAARARTRARGSPPVGREVRRGGCPQGTRRAPHSCITDDGSFR
ncbi:hypothetical protein DDQ41_07805 [Streptomyces spongiicola]|uniref:C3H1-type domain-containing protein n=1 Tax=Streptomyces spongiicola TaxID=1690221 RepID=A0ABM6V445_9ACTN|nr:hypothetical protein DDQ41_07805 [Streptomyces spongiicola]